MPTVLGEKKQTILLDLKKKKKMQKLFQTIVINLNYFTRCLHYDLKVLRLKSLHVVKSFRNPTK